MKLAIDIGLLLILALCTWEGYKRGVIGSIAAIVAIVVALFGGTLLSNAYAGEVIPALKPFVAGYVDSQENREIILGEMGYGNSDYSLADILASDSSLRYDYATECMHLIGLNDERADTLAARAVTLSENKGISMTDACVSVMCDTITFVGGLTIAFLMILILLVAFANVFNLSLRLPNMENVDEIGGAVLGFAGGFVYCMLLCWLLSFLGLLIGKNTIEGTVLARFFLTIKFLTGSLL